MAKITAEMLPEATAGRSFPRPHLSPKARTFSLTAGRAAFLCLCIAGTIAAPEPWIRAVLAVPFVVAAYIVGWSDGRRALSVELLLGRRNDRGPRLAPEQGGEPEGG